MKSYEIVWRTRLCCQLVKSERDLFCASNCLLNHRSKRSLVIHCSWSLLCQCSIKTKSFAAVRREVLADLYQWIHLIGRRVGTKTKNRSSVLSLRSIRCSRRKQNGVYLFHLVLYWYWYDVTARVLCRWWRVVILLFTTSKVSGVTS